LGLLRSSSGICLYLSVTVCLSVCIVLSQVVALVNDINDASYTNMPASLARGYSQSAPKPIVPRVPVQRPPVMAVMGPTTHQWTYKAASAAPVATLPRPVALIPALPVPHGLY